MINGIVVTLVSLLAFMPDADAATRGTEPGARIQRPRLSISERHTCAVRDDGTVRCFGANDQGQVGNGSVSPSVSSPTSPTGLFSVAGVAAGYGHSCAHVLGGALGSTVSCWGDNVFGQLGDGTNTDRSAPVAVGGLSGVLTVGAGYAHSCALVTGGTVRCWGSGADGALGTGNTTAQNTPVAVSGLAGVIAIAVGGRHTCALLAGGTVRCWGRNVSGQLGDGTRTQRNAPTVVGGLANVVAVAAGWAHSCALLVDGTAKCWGENQDSQVGDGTADDRLAPVAVLNLANAVAISTGIDHTCAVRSDGSASCWGSNVSGQLGDGTTTRRGTASTTVASLANVVEIAAGAHHTCAVEASGTGRCWGSNSLGQFGNGTTASSIVPVTVTGAFGSIGARGLVAGGEFSCARRGNGRGSCWGRDFQGQLGDGDTISSGPVETVNLFNAILLTAGNNQACGLAPAGTARCWGDNEFGQLGNGNTTDRTQAVGVAGIGDAVSIAMGHGHACALKVDGTVRCWGVNAVGQLGDGTQTASLTPVQVAGLSGVAAIAVGSGHGCALLVDGTVRCWGGNFGGQLGNGTRTDSSVPVTVTGLGGVIAIAAGVHYTCALLVAGTVSCWGLNTFGQLGNSTTTRRELPDTVAGLTDAVSIATGQDHTCALRADSSAVCWGRNTSGELGAADALDHLTPTPVIRTFTTVRDASVPVRQGSLIAIAPGKQISVAAHTCALLVNGSPQCWGDNTFNQVGDGSGVDRARPTTVPSFTANVAPAGELAAKGRQAILTTLVNCSSDGQALIFISLTQGDTTGARATVVACTDGLAETPIAIAARGAEGFVEGEATAELEAVIREYGTIADHLFWTRKVQLKAN